MRPTCETVNKSSKSDLCYIDSECQSNGPGFFGYFPAPAGRYPKSGRVYVFTGCAFPDAQPFRFFGQAGGRPVKIDFEEEEKLKRTLTSLCLLFGLLLSLAACGAPAAGTDPSQTETAPALQEICDGFLQAVAPDYAYDIALELTTNPDFFNSAQGGRNAGSDAEHAAAQYLADVMTGIGLQDVEKVAADCDRWQFNGASLTVDGADYAVYSYATASTPPEGLTAELVYAGKGTMWDYEDIDAAGKIVLIDIDQRNDWWITYPMLEAQY